MKGSHLYFQCRKPVVNSWLNNFDHSKCVYLVIYRKEDHCKIHYNFYTPRHVCDVSGVIVLTSCVCVCVCLSVCVCVTTLTAKRTDIQT